jgi:hypothetical protein
MHSEPIRHSLHRDPGPGRRIHDQAQRGAALVVSLVLLVIMTMLAISTMRTATLELVMAGNARERARALELSQTGITVAIALINENKLPLVAAEGWTKRGAVTGSDGQTGGNYRVDLRYLYRGKPPAPTEPEAAGAVEAAEAFYFEVESTGESGARKARSIQTQGLWAAAPGTRPVNLSYWFPRQSPGH